ncbi:MAG TPA: BON domain-containing protein [Candidatus Binatia bacterium]|jgi:hypothetical protein
MVKTVTAMLTGTGLGCLAMYALDPDAGGRRRALARDKMTKIQKKAGDAAATTARDLKNRALGTVAEARSSWLGGSIDDDVLKDRVRSEMGSLARYPRSIEVEVDDGRVTLAGPVFQDEYEQLLEGVSSIRGVHGLENRLQLHETAETFPGFQGELKPKPSGRPIDLLRENWSPATKFLVGFASTLALVGVGALAYRFSGNGNGLSISRRGRRRTRPRGWRMRIGGSAS